MFMIFIYQHIPFFTKASDYTESENVLNKIVIGYMLLAIVTIKLAFTFL